MIPAQLWNEWQIPQNDVQFCNLGKGNELNL